MLEELIGTGQLDLFYHILIAVTGKHITVKSIVVFKMSMF